MTARSSGGSRHSARPGAHQAKARGAHKKQYKGRRARKIITVIGNDDGRCYTAASAAKLITALRAFSFAEAESDQAWMQQVAERTGLMNGARINTANAELFISGLIRAGLLTEVPRYTAQQVQKAGCIVNKIEPG